MAFAGLVPSDHYKNHAGPSGGCKKMKRSADLDLQYNVNVSNKYASLSDSDTDSEDNIPLNRLNKKKIIKIPPVVMYSYINDHNKGLQALKAKLKDEVDLKYKGNKIIFLTKNMEDYNTVQAEISKANLEYHTYTPEEKRAPRMVLKHIPPNVTPEEIKEDLATKDLNVTKVVQMFKKNSDNTIIKYPMYIISFPSGTPMAKIFSVKKVCQCIVSWEKIKSNNGIIQCYRCQSFGHVAENCHRVQKCLKCSGPHNIKECQETLQKCANCKGNHNANERNCPEYARQNHLRVTSNLKKQEKTESKFTLNQREFPQLRHTNTPRVSPPQGSAWPKTGKNFTNTLNTNPDNAENNTSLLEIFSTVKELFASFNLNKVLHVIKQTADSVRNANDGTSKLMAIVEGVFNLFT